MKKTGLILIVVVVLLVIVLFVFNPFGGSDKQQVREQALALYEQKEAEGMEFSSQCLGTIDVAGITYVVDIVHVPRSYEDDLPENQCEDWRTGAVNHFVELDKDGNIVIID